jgi:uncharacterized phage protein gp47/JayE
VSTNTNLDEYYDFDNIMDRMLSRVDDTLDKREGSMIYDALSPAAAELAQMYIVLKNNIDLVFADTAVEEYLDKLVEQLGVSRKQAAKAIRKGLFYDENEELMDIELNERFTIGTLTYAAVEKIEKGTYKLECETAGIVGNNLSGTLVPIDYIQGLGKAILSDVLIPGEDEETDESLRQRFYEATNEKAFGGNIVDYQNRTKEIAGVGAVKVTPCWNGGGTVKLTILDSGFNKATDILIQRVQDTICPGPSSEGLGIAPIGHVVTVDTVTELEISVRTKLVLTGEVVKEDVKSEVETLINNYFLELKKEWEENDSVIVRISRIETILLNAPGVIDVENTALNMQSANIPIGKFQIPVLKEVVLL